MSGIAARVAAVMERGVAGMASLGGGASGSVWLVTFDDGSRAVAKTSDRAEGEGLEIEGRMLGVLAERSALPVPRVFHASRTLLVMEHRPGRSAFDEGAERHAAALLASLHNVQSSDGRYGLERDALVGPLRQPNTWSASWVEFWRERRVLHMTREGAREGSVPASLAARLERLAARLGELVPERPEASLIHGDVWSGNVLAESGRVTAFLDPAPYFAHAEVELSFITMFSTFGDGFFDAYQAARPIDPGFWSVRRHVYMVFPLLVHVRLFGGVYAGQLGSTLDMLGF